MNEKKIFKLNEKKKKFLKAERTQTIIHFYAKPTSDHVVLALTTTKGRKKKLFSKINPIMIFLNFKRK